jgi:hypothetical protein
MDRALVGTFHEHRPTAFVRDAAVKWGISFRTAMELNSEIPDKHKERPGGCITPNVSGGGTYYLCGNMAPGVYGANGLYYRVVPTP